MTLLTSLCLLCDSNLESSLSLCGECLHELPQNHNACPQCGLSLEQPLLPVCGRCQTQAPIITKTITPFTYEYAIKHLITELKFKKKLINAQLLGKLLADHINEQNFPLPDFLLPVPLHKKRLRNRGFNQAMELCRVLSEELNIPILTNSIKKTKETTAQAMLTAKQRKSNLRNNFTLNKKIPSVSIAIVDDVITTGTTVNELAKLLKKAGASQLQAWACARTL